MSGLKLKIPRPKHEPFSESESRKIIEDYLQSGLSKSEIWEKYTGRKTGECLILYWMRKYGYISVNQEKTSTFAGKNDIMKSENKNEEQSDFMTIQMQKRISDLEKQLSESEMKSIAWETMVELAEKEFNISIKKKFNIKPLKK
jgi:transposase